MNSSLSAPAHPNQSKLDLLDLIERDIAQARAVIQLLMLGEIDCPTLPDGTLVNTCWMLADKLDYIETNAKALMEV